MLRLCGYRFTRQRARSRGNRRESGGNMEGKEVLWIANSALYATVTTDACGAVNSCTVNSPTPLGGLVLVNIQLGEVVFGVGV
jgi:K+-transporting ATPase A subunit